MRAIFPIQNFQYSPNFTGKQQRTSSPTLSVDSTSSGSSTATIRPNTNLSEDDAAKQLSTLRISVLDNTSPQFNRPLIPFNNRRAEKDRMLQKAKHWIDWGRRDGITKREQQKTIKKVQFFLKQDVPVDTTSSDGQTFLRRAAFDAQPEVVKFLLRHRANPLHSSGDGRLPIDSARDSDRTGDGKHLANINIKKIESLLLSAAAKQRKKG
jgi:ankyrin repeat protein